MSQVVAYISAEYRGEVLTVLITEALMDAPHHEVLTEAVNTLLYAFEDGGHPGLARDDLTITIGEHVA